MDSMIDKVELEMMRKLLEENSKNISSHLYMIDDLMDEILILDNPEAMREVALFVKDILRRM